MAAESSTLPARTAAGEPESLKRGEEADELLAAIKDLVVDFIRAADVDASTKAEGHGLQQPGSGPRTVLLEHHPPKKLQRLLDISLPDQGQGFLDKLYAATTPVGLAADLLLSALNTNVHTYQVSPALTVIEKHTSAALAALFSLRGPFAGGISQPGGSAANQTSIVIARNSLYPDTKEEGYAGRRFALFTSAHGHYSVEKAAQMFGFGPRAVRAVPVDEKGCMLPSALDAAVRQAIEDGFTPFYVNATAGTTVLGSFDPVEAIADVCHTHSLWLHVDAAWGGPVVFSAKHKDKL